ncbi:MAG: hypothetical protein ACI8XC_004532 [Gammaproteobacteria bacterium]|jgi:hypothetical protein
MTINRSINRAIAGLIILLSSFFFSPVRAHSFNVIVITPMGEIIPRSMLNGFLLATREQDGHEDETSDGHLGGLDSHVLEIDSSAGNKDSINQLKNLISTSSPLFAVGLDLSESVHKMLQEYEVVVVDPVRNGLWGSVVNYEEQIMIFDGTLFSAAFMRDYRHLPDETAHQAYISARVIASIIRNSDEERRDNPVELRRAAKSLIENPGRLKLIP